ncbi:hypothetical protein [Massilia brevitalea]|uniref:hypothetical protein n=1 Tax=Massilia brevitalea TaxID=442526 RepID=UPI0027382F7F|nr:hypothetical protein [Massilia brevitalea]
MLYSVIWSANKKTAIAGGFWYSVLVFAVRVYPPLLHRLKAGKAKIKPAGKGNSESSVAHEGIRKGRIDYNANA